MLLASRLAAKSDCLVVYCVAERLPRGAGYRIHFKQAHPDVASANDLTAATAINEGIESIIGINPAQYLWSYKRYRANAHAPVNPYKRVQPEPIEPLRKAA
jgi:KDO2-lipid IV(A) lauroyltransferase